jgi:hypothetical protein
MLFITKTRQFRGGTAVEIVRKMESDSAEYSGKGGIIREFLIWSLERMANEIPQRELDVSPDLDDETNSYNFLCLLDNFHLGTFYEEAN